ncbi:hypothetical protein L861_03675 [Litchfieldella anticariensis FP35 = DSM 16096]|uniref:DUF2069 domain-containing protein n=1 Tax=Litchfieldella anticariensis (strain DSM 16096 / CECT 5854 / CIP 108499 / LMG 22089 / FP35) TaxID=1121939 RepID=S2KRC9_LITA3|nr:DUF2069 domain-containing protein [Halomonas anticariensis]EPC04435.1 hypothetical protein L861_03675 [Halomonas anticariensis FP35 = DSM 16096]
MRQLFERLEERHGLDILSQRSRQVVLGSYVALLVLLSYGGLRLHGVEESSIAPFVLRVLPLILFLPSILAQRPRGHAWLAFVSLLYFMQGVMITTLPGQTLLGMLEILASLTLFVGSMCYARFRSRQQRR